MRLVPRSWFRLSFVVLACAGVTLAFLPVQWLLIGLRLKKISAGLPKYWHRAMLAILDIRVHYHGEIDASRPLMLACNHVSWKDILVLGAVADVVFVAKTEVGRWPVIGALARLQRTIFIERSQQRNAGAQAGEIAIRLGQGELIVLFPEGTTSDGNRLLDVKSSLFGAAIAAISHSPAGQVYVQPLAIAYTKIHGMALGHYHRPLASWPGDVALWPHVLAIMREGALDVDLCFGEAIVVDHKTNRKQLSALAQRDISRMLTTRLRGRLWQLPLI